MKLNFKPLTQNDITITVSCEPDHDEIDGHFDSGDAEDDRDMVEKIKGEVRSGNEWAWCVVTVRSEWGGFVASDTLGACSYESKQDFIDNSGYYDDMVKDQLEDLNDSVKESFDKIAGRIEVEVPRTHGRDLNAEDMARTLDEWVNAHNYERPREAFAEQIVHRTHRTLQQAIMRLFVSTIVEWADRGQEDPRNAATVALAKKIVAAIGDKYDRHLPTI